MKDLNGIKIIRVGSHLAKVSPLFRKTGAKG